MIQDTSDAQKRHYDRIACEYVDHYDDIWSQNYYRRFIIPYMIEGIPIHGKEVLEVMCGSGQVSQALQKHGANTAGLDISQKMLEHFQMKIPGSRVIHASLFENNLEDGSFDHIFVSGGLHHLCPFVDQAVEEIYRLLRPGGFFVFFEPHEESVLNSIRRVWYRNDALFEQNETALKLEALQSVHKKHFEFVRTRYLGGPAYLLVLNSMVFRIPASWKKWYSGPMLFLESCFLPFQSRRMSCAMVCQWKKKAD